MKELTKSQKDKFVADLEKMLVTFDRPCNFYRSTAGLGAWDGSQGEGFCPCSALSEEAITRAWEFIANYK